MNRSTFFAVLAVIAALPRSSQADPTFVYAKPEEVKEVVWKAAANVGFIYTSGNSNTLTLSGGASASRNDGKNKAALEVAGAFAQSTTLTAVTGLAPDPSDPTHMMMKTYVIGVEKGKPNVTTANALAKLRYDRFFTPNNSLYIDGFAGLDKPASKELFTGGQVGYARQILHSARHLLSAEVGYDFNYTVYTADPSVALHSVRAFLGYALTLRKDTGVAASIEALINGNSVTVAGNSYGFAEATRLNGKVALTTVIYKKISFRFGFTARYDNAPATIPKVGGDIPYLPGFKPPLVQKLDTITEAALLVTFL